jgi:hypothetical protein
VKILLDEKLYSLRVETEKDLFLFLSQDFLSEKGPVKAEFLLCSYGRNSMLVPGKID